MKQTAYRARANVRVERPDGRFLVWPAFIMFLAAILLVATCAQCAVELRGAPAAASLLGPPTSGDGTPVKVSVALVLLNVTDIDEVEQRFHVNAYLFMRWQDPRLKDASPQPGATAYAKGEIWSPTVEVINAVDPRQSVDARIVVDAGGAVLYTERFSAAVTSKFALRNFPFDSQTLHLVIRPYVGDRKTFSLVTGSLRSRTVPEFKLYSSLASWEVERLGTQTVTVEAADGGPVSEARFELSLRRKSAFYVWKVIVPLLLMVSLSWAVFWIEAADLATQVQIAVTTVLTIIAFAFAISGSLPRVPYLTFIDAFFLTCYLFVFIAIAELMSVHVSHRTRGSGLAERIRRQSRWLVPIAFTVANALLLVDYGII